MLPSDPAQPAPAAPALSPDERALVQAARDARERAYAPYSSYMVGAALKAGGVVYPGANVENASYGLSICAERVACAAAAMAGVRVIETVAVVSQSTPPAAPCGMCLQTLIEFCSDPRAVRVLLANTGDAVRVFTLADLIPHSFDKSQLTT